MVIGVEEKAGSKVIDATGRLGGFECEQKKLRIRKIVCASGIWDLTIIINCRGDATMGSAFGSRIKNVWLKVHGSYFDLKSQRRADHDYNSK